MPILRIFRNVRNIVDILYAQLKDSCESTEQRIHDDLIKVYKISFLTPRCRPDMRAPLSEAKVSYGTMKTRGNRSDASNLASMYISDSTCICYHAWRTMLYLDFLIFIQTLNC